MGGSKGQGNFYYPTLLSEVTSQMMCAREEIFGPIAGVLRLGPFDYHALFVLLYIFMKL